MVMMGKKVEVDGAQGVWMWLETDVTDAEPTELLSLLLTSGLWEQMKLTDMNQFLASQTLKNQDLIKDFLLIFSCFFVS